MSKTNRNDYYQNEINEALRRIEEWKTGISESEFLRNKTPVGFNSNDIKNMHDNAIKMLSSFIEEEQRHIDFYKQQIK